MSGYSGTPLATKLGISAGSRVFVQGAPQNYDTLVAPLPARVTRASSIDANTDLIHLFVVRRTRLAAQLRTAVQRMRSDACIWVSWPKRACGVATDVTEDVIRELALPMRLVDIKVCAFDETWSGLKLVIRKSVRIAATVRQPVRRK